MAQLRREWMASTSLGLRSILEWLAYLQHSDSRQGD